MATLTGSYCIRSHARHGRYCTWRQLYPRIISGIWILTIYCAIKRSTIENVLAVHIF